MRLTEKIDGWWSYNTEKRRLDRRPYYAFINVGLFVFSLSTIAFGAVPSSSFAELSTIQQRFLVVFIFLGTALNITGSLMGSKYFFPLMLRIPTYHIGLCGNPLIISSVGFYTVVLIDRYDNPTSLIGFNLSLAIVMGALANMILFILEIRRIEKNLQRIQEATLE